MAALWTQQSETANRSIVAIIYLPMLVLGYFWVASDALAGDNPLTGPETERRFPPLKVPTGFRATLFACDPLVEYPSVIARGPEPGALFVAYDYLTGLGEEIVRRDEVRIVRDRDHDGYADESQLFAGEFNSIQGLATHGGTVYVMHAPFLTSVRDLDGDGTADERRDLLVGLGLPPEENSNRLHCANGVVVGHDGWLYLALGDRGCDVARPEGDRLIFQEGGILRCRSDGRDLHVFSTGLRNIYDVALDEELNVFVRDNENDGGDYMIRVNHCFHGSDHGYPYLYRERPDEALPPLADLGRGSSAGGTAYLETAFPEEYRQSLFFCEWGRAVVRYRKQRDGSGFRLMPELDFAAGAPSDPYGFKPTDVVVDRDGSLLISDWADGQRPKRGRGRIYRITYDESPPALADHQVLVLDETAATDTLLDALNSPSHHRRIAAQELLERRGISALEPLRQAVAQQKLGPLGRLHAIWILASVAEADAVEEVLQLAARDSDPRVQAQAVRAIADLTDPVLATHRLDAVRGDEVVCHRLGRLWTDADTQVRLEILIAMGRLHWAGAPNWMRRQGPMTEAPLLHAAMQMLRRANNWPAVLELLDLPESEAVAVPNLRVIALRALADEAQVEIIEGLIARCRREQNSERRKEYFELLSRVYRKPAAWTYWGFRPSPRPANSVNWERTLQINEALDIALADADVGVRAAVVRRMLRENIPVRLERIERWLEADDSPHGVAAILEALTPRPLPEARASLERILTSKAQADFNRLAAFSLLMRDGDPALIKQLRQWADMLDESSVLAAIIEKLVEERTEELAPLLVARLSARHDDVRAAAAWGLCRQPVPEIAARVCDLLGDQDLRIRRAAAVLAGKLEVRQAADQLLKGLNEQDREFRGHCLESLRRLGDARAVELSIPALEFPETQLAAISYLGEFGSPEHLDAIMKTASQVRALEVLTAAVDTCLKWRDRPKLDDRLRREIDQRIALLQGQTGIPLVWRVKGPLLSEEAQAVRVAVARPAAADTGEVTTPEWPSKRTGGSEAAVVFDADAEFPSSVWLAVTDIVLEKPSTIEFLVGTNMPFSAWLDGLPLVQQEPQNDVFSDHRIDRELSGGPHRLLVELKGGLKSEFRFRFRVKSSKAEHERLIQLVLDRTGDVQRGRQLLLNAEKSQCLKCHQWGTEGGRIGPDLSGVGSRFSRIYLAESVLDPSRTIAPSYGTVVVTLFSGQVLTGVRFLDSDQQLTLGDSQGKLHEILKSDVDELQTQSKSTMPDGLEQRLTNQEFLDLIEFLSSLKKSDPQ